MQILFSLAFCHNFFYFTEKTTKKIEKTLAKLKEILYITYG